MRVVLYACVFYLLVAAKNRVNNSINSPKKVVYENARDLMITQNDNNNNNIPSKQSLKMCAAL